MTHTGSIQGSLSEFESTGTKPIPLSSESDWANALESREIKALRFDFNADWRVYWRIWIVNLGLSIMTLGIYSAWAKVRTKRYFYGHVAVAGNSFDYHGRPLAILRGRLIAAALFVSWLVCTQIGPVWISGALLIFMLLLPWLVVQAARFRACNSSWRGLRFGFDGTSAQAFLRYTMPWLFVVALVALTFWISMQIGPKSGRTTVFLPLISLLIVYLSLPAIFTAQKRFVVNHHTFGSTRFDFNGSASNLLGIYILTALLMIPLRILAVLLDKITMHAAEQLGPWMWQTFPESLLESEFGTALLLIILSPVLLLAGSPILFGLGYLRGSSMVWQWENTALGPHVFRCNLNPWMMAMFYFRNALVIALSLGLLIPWAMTRTVRLRAESLQLLYRGSLDDFVASMSKSTRAVGDELGEIVGLDVGI